MNEQTESKVIVLQTEQGEHVGFTLINPDLGQTTGDCVFMIVPKNPELFKTREVDALLSFKENGEHQWRWEEDEITVSFQGDDILQYSSSGEVIHIPSQIKLGLWKIPPKKK